MPVEKLITWSNGRQKVKSLAVLPSAGSFDQVLVKASSAEGDAIWKPLSQAMVIGALSVGSISPSFIAQDPNNRFITDAQASYWNGKVDRSELSAYLPLTGGNMAYGAKISFDPNSYIGYGNGDNATTSAYNLEIASWWGIGFKSTVDNITRIVFDTRAGRILSKAVRVSDFADGTNAVPVISDSNGNLVKSAFSADWINTNGNRRFVTDVQVGQWNNKVERTELGAYLPLSGGYLTGKVEIQAVGGTHWSDSKLVVVTTDNTKHPSITLHSPGSSAVTIYQRNFDLYIRTDYTDAGALVHKRIWSENNHGVGSGLNADLLDGFHASYFTDVNNLITTTGKRLVSDTQVSYWNGKVDRSELGAYLPLAGGTMTGRVMFDQNCYFGYGTGDGATLTTYNLEIASWYGIGFKDTNAGKTKIVFDTRAGRILASSVRLSDFADGTNAVPVISDSNGNLVKSAFSADWINTNLNRQFVSDTQVSLWSNKVERSELGAYLPLSGGVISGKLDILAQGGTRLEEAKLCISTTNTSKPPSIAFHTPGVSAIQLYEKLGHLYIRNDNGTAYDNVNYKVWTQMNHGVDSGLNADLLDGYHASYFTDANNLVTNSNRRFATDTQISYWNGKVDRTELGAYLPLAGGTMTGAIRFNAAGSNNGMSAGTGDGATTTAYNLEIASWYGIGFKSSVDNTTKIVFDTRAGRIMASSIRISDFADGTNAVPVIADSNGSLVKSAFSADWINTNGNRRFVTDVQVGQWNNKVERSELGAYLPLSGGYLTGKVEIQAVGGTHWSDSKLVVVTTDNTKHPSITLHSPGSSAVTIYQRNFDLYIRTDYSDAGALVHKRIWSENNHGVGSGLNADLLDGFHASYFTDVNNLITTTGKRLVSDTQVSYWNGKVDRSELGAYLPLAGGNMAYGAKISFDPNSYIGYGNGDNATTSAYNLEIASWWGIGFKSTVDNITRIVFDTRAGRILSKAVRVSDFADGTNAVPVISDSNGNLVKSAFSADWINTSPTRRFVTDTQISQWGNKVERSELGAYLPLSGGVISGKLDILAQGGTRLEEAKLCISTTNTSKPPSIAFHTPGVSAIQLYEKLGHLYIRNDNGTAYDNVNYKVWTQMNHGVDSGLNADLLDGYHASYFTDANNLVTNSNRRFATDTQISYWNGKVDRTELGAYLPLAGGTMTGAIRFNAAGSNNGMSAGTGDGATTTAYNLEIASWYGIGFKSTLDNTTKIVFDTRAGKIQASKVLLSDFADGQVDRLVVSQGDGSLVRSDKVRFGYNNHISTGTGDNATESTYNFEIASWWGIGFKCNVDNTTRIVFDTRAGRILSKAVRISDFADGQNAVPVVSDGSGNLTKSAFSADWINTNGNRRFVTDVQVGQWNNKVERSELGAYLPLSGGYLTGKVEIQAVGGTHWSDSKLAVITTDNTKHPSITLHSPGSSAVTIYQRNFDLYIRTDYSDAGALVHKRIWSENNHGIGSGLNADLLDGFHASYFTDVNNLITTTGKRLVSDTQVSYWNGKVDRSELGAYLPLAGGTMTGRVMFDPNCYFAYGTGDGATPTTYNLEIASWYGIGFKDTNAGKTKIIFDTRAGQMQSKKVFIANFDEASYHSISLEQGKVSFIPANGLVGGHISVGNADSATTTGYNLQIGSWYGIGFKDTCYGNTHIVFDLRQGRILSKAVRISDFADGTNAIPVISDANGNLVKSAFSADWINANANRRFVTDAQITYWNSKSDSNHTHNWDSITGKPAVFNILLQENANDKGIYNTVNFSSGAYNVVQVDGNVVRYHVDVVNDDARWSNAITNPVSVALVKSKIDGKADWGHTHHWDSIVGKPAFNISLQENAGDKGQYSTINFSSGAYNVVQVDGNVVRYHVDVVNDEARWSNAITNPVSVALVKSKIDGKADWGHTHNWDSITGKPSEFSPSAHSHHWDSIVGKPANFSPSPHGHDWNDISGAPIWVSNGSALISNFILYSPKGCIFGDMSSFNSILTSSLTLTGSAINIKDIPQVSKSNAPYGYLTIDYWGNVVFVQHNVT